MTDPSLRDLFAAGPGAEPPMRLSVDSLLEAGRTARRRRRGTLTAAGTGLSVVAVVTAVTASLAGGAPASLAPADGSSGVCASPGSPGVPVTPSGGGAAPVTPEASPSRVPTPPGAVPETSPGRTPVPPATAPETSPGRVPVTPGAPPQTSPGRMPVPPATAPETSPGRVPVTPGAPPQTSPGGVPVTPGATASADGFAARRAPTSPSASPTDPPPTGAVTVTPPPTGAVTVTPPPTGAVTVAPPPTSEPTRRPRTTAEVTPPGPVRVSPEPEDTCAPAVPPTAARTPTGPTRAATTSAAPETEAQRLHRLTTALRHALPLPAGARLVHSTSGRPGYGTLEVYPSQGGYKAAADVRDPLGRGSIFVEIRAATLPSDQDCAAQHCTVTARGDIVTAQREKEGTGTVLIVQAIRTDGTSVLVAATDYAANDQPSGKNAPAPRSQRPTLPWTRSQLTTLALTPTLHL